MKKGKRRKIRRLKRWKKKGDLRGKGNICKGLRSIGVLGKRKERYDAQGAQGRGRKSQNGEKTGGGEMTLRLSSKKAVLGGEGIMYCVAASRRIKEGRVREEGRESLAREGKNT